MGWSMFCQDNKLVYLKCTEQQQYCRCIATCCTVVWYYFKCEILCRLTLPAVDTLKWYSKALEYEYRVKTAALGTLKRYSIFSLTLYLE
jgi:hypothetical protein